MNEKKTFVVEQLEGADPYKLATGLIVPRPIGWIGTLSAEGIPNLAPFSFFNCVSGNPPMFVFSAGRSARRDTLDNVRSRGEFTINIVSEEVAEAMNATSASLDADVNEFEVAGLTEVQSTRISAPMVAECKANIECVVTDILDIGHQTKGNALVVGEGIVIHIDDQLLDGTRIDQVALRAIGRHAGNSYSRSTDQFELARPE